MPSDADRPATETASQPLPGNEAGNGENVDTGTTEQPGTQRKFGSLTPQEAGRRSAEARRRKSRAQDEEAVAASDGRVLIVRVPVPIGDIIGRLSTDAKKAGGHAAARELRAYLDAYPVEDETDVSALDRRTRQQVIARLLEEIREDEGSIPSRPLDAA